MIKLIVFMVFMVYPTPALGEQRSEGDFYYLAEAIYFEARGEAFAGQVAVAQNIIHRVNSTRFPNSIEKVVHQSKEVDGKNICQYSYYCDGKPDIMIDLKSKREAFRVASMVIRGEIPDLIEGADHYFNPELVLPVWASKMTYIIRIGDHSFYRADGA